MVAGVAVSLTRKHTATIPTSGNNNNTQAHPPPERHANALDSTSLKDLSEREKEKILQNIGYLFGFRMDRIDHPTRSLRPVAERRSKEPPCVREVNDIVAEFITTKNEREANYVHQGWSVAAASIISPWISSRIARRNQPNYDGVWTTKRTIVQRLTFCLSLEELVPEPGFKSDIEEALRKPTICERFKAVYRALDIWGDAVPLEFDVGVSLAFTDLEANMTQLPNLGTYNNLNNLLDIKSARVAKRGGDSALFNSADGKWLTATVPPDQWCQVRIVTAAPTLDLLEDDLKAQLSDLHNQLWSRSPLLTIGPTMTTRSLEDSQYIANKVSCIRVFGADCINSISLDYLDGTKSHKHGGTVPEKDEYMLANHEYITEMLVWSDANWVHGLQFVTNTGRLSPHYGGPGGTPKVGKSKGGVLGGFSSVLREQKQWKTVLLSEVQGIWRHDILSHLPKEDDVFSDYFGGAGGIPFNDRRLLGNSNSMYISRVDVGCGDTAVESIQFTYVHYEGGRSIESKAPQHGHGAGPKRGFVLARGEHIVTISGKHGNGLITQLCFATNLGRASEVFGVGSGREFTASAPQDSLGISMRLHYTCGKSGSRLDGIVFVWTSL